MILYFSGTGNSEYAARQIASETHETFFSISDSFRARRMPRIPKEETLVFVVPTYAWRIPRLVEKWIRANSFIEGQKAFFVMTCGDSIGHPEPYLRKLCSRKKLTFMGCMEIIMPENYIAMFDVPSSEEAGRIIRNSEPRMALAARYIREGCPFPKRVIHPADRVKSGIVNVLFYPLFVHADRFHADDRCIGCGTCAKVCPLGNISLKDGKPVWGKNCTHCMACICSCPTEAVEYGKASVGRNRYHGPVQSRNPQEQ